MEFQLNAAGKRVIPGDFKKQVLKELSDGATTAELARRYQVPIQNIIRWRRNEITASEVKFKKQIVKSPQAVNETELLAEYRRVVDENKKLRRSLANMTMDRDILKDAVDIAAKKKWI